MDDSGVGHDFRCCLSSQAIRRRCSLNAYYHRTCARSLPKRAVRTRHSCAAAPPARTLRNCQKLHACGSVEQIAEQEPAGQHTVFVGPDDNVHIVGRVKGRHSVSKGCPASRDANPQWNLIAAAYRKQRRNGHSQHEEEGEAAEDKAGLLTLCHGVGPQPVLLVLRKPYRRKRGEFTPAMTLAAMCSHHTPPPTARSAGSAGAWPALCISSRFALGERRRLPDWQLHPMRHALAESPLGGARRSVGNGCQTDCHHGALEPVV